MERQLLSPHSALACDIFDQFCNASTLKSIMVLHRRLCDTLNLHSTIFPTFYPEIKGKLYSWRAQELWTSIDKRASHKCYANGTACTGTKVLIIGAGPCGLRTAIEAQLLGAKVIVVEKRDELSRNNVIHLWQFVIQDLRSLGAKKFFGKFCAGSIDHISIRQLQLILCKIALMIGVEVHIGVNFKSLIPPPEDQEKRVGWRAELSPADHAICQYEFDVIIGADGRKQTLEGFGCKEFRGKLAIAITANFINRHTDAEARVEEISGVSFVFNQKFFKELYQNTGVDLENIAYYKDDTHYFVMTAKKPSLIKKGVIKTDPADTARLLSPGNVNQEALRQFAREAADFATKYQLPAMEFAVNHHGQPDVAMFDFTSMSAAENATKIIERRGHRLLTMLVGDSLLESFWPTGSGCARGFLSSLDACWAIRAWGSGTVTPLEVAAERESTYRLLAQTTPDNLSKDFNSYTLEPHTRYPILNLQSVLPMDVKHLIDTDNDTVLLEKSTATEFVPVKRRRKESHVHPGVELLPNKKVAVYDAIVNQADKALGAFPAPNTMEVIAVTPNTEEEVQHCSTAIGDRTLTDKHDVLNASTEDIAVTSSLELARRPSIEIVYCTPTTPVLQQKCKPFIEQEGKCEAEPHGGATAQSAPQKAAEQHGSTEDSNPTLKQTVQCKTNNVSGSITTMKKGVKRGSIEVIEVTPTLQQVEKPPSVNGPLVDADCCEGAQSLQLQKELENKMPRIEVTPAMQPNPPSSPRSPPVTNNLSPNHFWTPPAPSHPPQVYHSSGGQSLTPPAIHSPFSFSPPSPAYSYPSSTYSQPPNFLPPPYPHPQTPLYYPYQQYDTHPQQSQHPQPQHPHANWGQLPEQPNRQHEKIPVVYQFEKVEGATFIVSNNQTSPNVSPGAKQLEQPKTMAQPLGHSEERVGQAKHIIVLETDKGMNDSTLYGLSSHIINILMSSRPGCKEMSSDLADLHVLGHMDSVKFFVEVKNFRGANKVLQLNGSDVFGVTLRAYLTDKVDEEAVSVVPLP